MADLLRLKDVMRRTGLGRSTIYLYVGRGEFPAPRRLTSTAVAWRSDEVDAWVEARPVARPEPAAA